MEYLSLNAYPPVPFCCALLQGITWRGRRQRPNADGSLGHGMHARIFDFEIL